MIHSSVGEVAAAVVGYMKNSSKTGSCWIQGAVRVWPRPDAFALPGDGLDPTSSLPEPRTAEIVTRQEVWAGGLEAWTTMAHQRDRPKSVGDFRNYDWVHVAAAALVLKMKVVDGKSWLTG